MTRKLFSIYQKTLFVFFFKKKQYIQHETGREERGTAHIVDWYKIVNTHNFELINRSLSCGNMCKDVHQSHTFKDLSKCWFIKVTEDYTGIRNEVELHLLMRTVMIHNYVYRANMRLCAQSSLHVLMQLHMQTTYIYTYMHICV